MIAHYLIIAVANLRKALLVAAANVLTLALGLACFIAAYGIASWWRSADGHHPAAERIVVVGQGLAAASGGRDEPVAPLSTPALARHLLSNAAGVESAARALPRAAAPVAAGEAKAFLDMAYVDPVFLEIFAFDFVAGDARSALSSPDGVVLTEAAAARLFGAEPALGRDVVVDRDWTGTVRGVIAPVRQPSFMGEDPAAVLPFQMLRSWQSFAAADAFEADDRWLAANLYTFVVLDEGLTAARFNEQLAALAAERVPPARTGGSRILFEAFPLHELTTRELDQQLSSEGQVGVSAVATLIGLGLLTLLVACVNYANLATAQAAGRTKEIGLRKVLGADRVQVMTQAFVEAGLSALAAVLAALLVLALAVPAVRSATGIDMLHFLVTGPEHYAVIVGLVGLVALLAGAWPALVLSRVRPAEALIAGRSRAAPRFVARILVGVQFAAASFLLILVTVTQLQRALLQTAAAPAGGDPVIVLNDLGAAGVDFSTLEARLQGLPGVRSVSVSDRRPWSRARDPIYFTRTPAPDEATVIAAPMGYLRGVGYDYFETVGLRLLAGRDFDRERDAAPSSLYADDPARIQPVVLDETYARRLGFSSAQAAVGQRIFMPAFSNAQMTRPTVTIEVIGVVEADASRLEAWRADGNIFVYGPNPQFPVVRVDPASLPAAVAAITRIWDTIAPTVPVDIRYADQLFAEAFRTFARVGQVFMLLAAAAFVIASIGLLGMAVHVASRRRHEIGVRKTLGSTTLGIARLLLTDFSKPILIANLLAWPLGYLAAETYLSAFAERVPLTPAPFVLSLAITLLIAWLAVTGEVVKAASLRPVEVLRHA